MMSARTLPPRNTMCFRRGGSSIEILNFFSRSASPFNTYEREGGRREKRGQTREGGRRKERREERDERGVRSEERGERREER